MGECFKVGEHFVGRVARGNVVVSRIEDDRSRFVLEDYSVGEVVDVWDCRTAEAAVDHWQIRERVGCLPESDRRTADEEDTVFRRGVLVVPLFERSDFRFEPRGTRGLLRY